MCVCVCVCACVCVRVCVSLCLSVHTCVCVGGIMEGRRERERERERHWATVCVKIADLQAHKVLHPDTWRAWRSSRCLALHFNQSNKQHLVPKGRGLLLCVCVHPIQINRETKVSTIPKFKAHAHISHISFTLWALEDFDLRLQWFSFRSDEKCARLSDRSILLFHKKICSWRRHF